MLRKLFGSISIGGILSALGGYVFAHVDPAITAPVSAVIGAVGAVVGAVTHHVNTKGS